MLLLLPRRLSIAFEDALICIHKLSFLWTVYLFVVQAQPRLTIQHTENIKVSIACKIVSKGRRPNGSFSYIKNGSHLSQYLLIYSLPRMAPTLRASLGDQARIPLILAAIYQHQSIGKFISFFDFNKYIIRQFRKSFKSKISNLNSCFCLISQFQ